MSDEHRGIRAFDSDRHHLTLVYLAFGGAFDDTIFA
jgi:hypothetical protein